MQWSSLKYLLAGGGPLGLGKTNLELKQWFEDDRNFPHLIPLSSSFLQQM